MNETGNDLDRLPDYFSSKIAVRDSGCWEWTGARTPDGYGQAYRQLQKGVKNTKLAHRLVYMLLRGPIPPGLFACHHCDNPPCVNPDHIFLGDFTANSRDCVRKKRHMNSKKTHCKHGHEFTPENTRIWRKTGRRFCKMCSVIRSIDRWERIRPKNAPRRRKRRDATIPPNSPMEAVA